LLPPEIFDLLSAKPPDGSSYWRLAIGQSLLTDEQILSAIARRSHLKIASALHTSAPARLRVPEWLARRYGVLPLTLSETTLEIATGNPYDLECEQMLAFVSGKHVRMTLASPTQIAERLDEVYRPETAVAKLLAGMRSGYLVEAVHETPAADALGASRTSRTSPTLDRPMVQLVDHIVAEGIAMRASDIHLEAEENGIAVRYRVDGMLRQVMVLPKGVGIPLVSRVKIMARMDIADRLRPQGGRARVTIDGAPVDLRVSTLPAAHGEKVVVRILDPRSAATSLDALGLDTHSDLRLRGLIDAREGLILVTGPTGSGKTTTLYAALHQLLGRNVNIVTVEDPVEYRVPGIVQVQVNAKAGLTFAEALRSILRQDPDVVLIGEVRDKETATIAIQAALTGHLVFATLHTIDACSSITRLHDLGIEPGKIASALKGVVAQRLVRHLCASCATISTAPLPSALWTDIPSGATLLSATGCGACNTTGYKGRFAVTEILTNTPELERMIARSATTAELIATARHSGTCSLWASGVARLLSHETTVDELLRVLEPDRTDLGSTPFDESEHPEYDPVAVDMLAPAHIDDVHQAQYDIAHATAPPHLHPTMTDLKVGVVDVYIIDPSVSPWRTLALRRGEGTRCTGAWEAVHGRIEYGETPEQAALRELREETGLDAQRLYNVTVHAFYLHKMNAVQLAVVFCAFADSTQQITLGPEHEAFAWLPLDQASDRFIWPRATQALREIHKLLGSGNAGPAEDVLRVR
jgi:type II secretory ATPase GspE/PulE/Tfp pilus assembly ATPase PilB-like protein/8-oxo-dGTP pyrophosphatase MutT (NUDIX family)